MIPEPEQAGPLNLSLNARLKKSPAAIRCRANIGLTAAAEIAALFGVSQRF